MALQKEYKTKYGAIFPEAYHRISYVAINRALGIDEQIIIYLDIWVDAAARQDALPVVNNEAYTINATKNKLSDIADAYNKVKELDFYKDSIDV